MRIDEVFSHILLLQKILYCGLVLARIEKLIGYKQGFRACLFYFVFPLLKNMLIYKNAGSRDLCEKHTCVSQNSSQ